MPTTKDTWDARLIELFLSTYDDGRWRRRLADHFRPDSQKDGGVDMLAVRRSDGQRLAIEHTRIEPFDGERSDYYQHFKPLQDELRSDPSLRVSGHAIYLEAPVGALPHGASWPAIIADVKRWVLDEHPSFTDERSERLCPSSYHPDGGLLFHVHKVFLNASASFMIVQRYGETRLGESVDKALRSKLPKLTKEQADRRLLMLERDNGWLSPDDILGEVNARRTDYPKLADVNEVWIADTAGDDTGTPSL